MSVDCPVKKPINLKYLLDDTVHVDTLYYKAAQNVQCTPQRCTNAMLASTSNPLGRTKEVLLAHAIDFINQFYSSIKRENTKAHLDRVEEVKALIEKNSTYELTESELAFATRTAWRNAVRCIGRIQWSRLQVFDARNVTNTKSMFEAMCDHLRYATNNGNIRSAVTVFPARKFGDPSHDFRVWNGQFLGYAGYKQPDGSVIGDKGHIEITEVCEKLGWVGKKTDFDVLPLVLQANGGEPHYYELPPELVLEVKITHPTYPWFAELGLKWYCVPGVSNMLLDAGGLEFTACPFNGWYMGTELGRDFADENRYNKLPLIAERMGLDTRANVTLWKDKALVELNFAVLYSFQKAGVTIVDHHSAAESFMTHYENEKRLRGGCPADWVWVVPPMSSHLTPVFHLEMLNYVLKPSYEYQLNPWVTAKPKDQAKVQHKIISKSNKTGKHRFKEVAEAIIFSNKMMGKALAKRIACTILYATETGRSEKFAKQLGETFQLVFNAKVKCMDEYDISNLKFESLLLIVASTFGNGDAPDNGNEFKKLLNQLCDENSGSWNKKEFEHDPLSNVKFAVFGLGNSSYPKYCAFAKLLDSLLERLGAERVNKIGFGDELSGQDKSFNAWANEVFKSCSDAFFITRPPKMLVARQSVLLADPERRISPADKNLTMDVNEMLSIVHSRSIPTCTVQEVQRLSGINSQKKTILVKLSIKNNKHDFSCLPGDHLAIFPSNRQEIVNRIIPRLKLKKYISLKDQLLKVEIMEEKLTKYGKSRKWIKDELFPYFTLKDALTYLYDITTPLTQKMLSLFIPFAKNSSEADDLRTLSEDESKYENWKYQRWPTLADTLDMFPSLEPTALFILTNLPKLQPRFYSISSSPKVHHDEIHLTVGVVEYTPRKSNSPNYGVCSKWLEGLPRGTKINAFIRKAPSFRLPSDKTLPVIMIGAGTGIAPYRAFWQERQLERSMIDNPTGTNVIGWGDMVLYFGCRTPKNDELFKDEIDKLLQDSTLAAYHVACSREPNKPKIYVQNHVLENGATIYDYIINKHGHIYICGDVTMANGVHEALEKVLKTHGQLSAIQAKQKLEELKDEMVLHEDIYGNNDKIDNSE